MYKHIAIEELLVVAFSVWYNTWLYSEGKQGNLVEAISSCQSLAIKDMSTGAEVSTLVKAITTQ
jgi:methionine aminopeptidase